MAFVRFFWIVYLFFKYRLDELIPKNFIPAWLFLFFKLNPFRLNKNSKNSGERLSEALEKAGPVFVKFGQILSTRPDLINDEIISNNDLILHGHTHRFRLEKVESCVIFNPGECAGMMKGKNQIGLINLESLEPHIISF